VDASVETEPQQRVPGGVELELVDALAVAVVRSQRRRMLVREPPPFEWLAAERLAERGDLLLPGRSALPRDGLDKWPIRREEVVAHERRRLVRRRARDPGRGHPLPG
jgi:hypothetical protein